MLLIILDGISTVSGILSCICWLVSASIKWPFELAPDENHRLAQAAAKSGRWNALAAVSATISALLSILARHI